MNPEIPLYGQEKDETCALACLRMVLAAHGTYVDERALAAEARMEEGGTDIEELQRLANQFGLVADIQHATTEELRTLLTEGRIPIAYVNRRFFELRSLHQVAAAFADPQLHAVIPIRITRHFITFLDPRKPPRVARRSLARFDRAHRFLRYVALVCEAPASTETSR